MKTETAPFMEDEKKYEEKKEDEDEKKGDDDALAWALGALSDDSGTDSEDDSYDIDMDQYDSGDLNLTTDEKRLLEEALGIKAVPSKKALIKKQMAKQKGSKRTVRKGIGKRRRVDTSDCPRKLNYKKNGFVYLTLASDKSYIEFWKPKMEKRTLLIQVSPTQAEDHAGVAKKVFHAASEKGLEKDEARRLRDKLCKVGKPKS